MKLVLLKDIKHLGKVGDEVNVKGGFARNFLLPTKSALTPSDENIEIISKMKDELMEKEKEAKNHALTIKEKLAGYKQVYNLEVKEDSDELFGSITLQNIADKIDYLIIVNNHKGDILPDILEGAFRERFAFLPFLEVESSSSPDDLARQMSDYNFIPRIVTSN